LSKKTGIDEIYKKCWTYLNLIPLCENGEMQFDPSTAMDKMVLAMFAGFR
jgi:hypothetical protein